jgi:hypothetical protein
MIVYKYLHSDRIDVLENRRIRFTQPSALNDPFECFPDLSLYKAKKCQELKESAERKELSRFGEIDAGVNASLFDIGEKLISQISKYFVFLSLSKRRVNLLMWSHYAQDHKGFVVGFERDCRMFNPNSLSDFGLTDIEYSQEKWGLPEDGLSSMTEAEIDLANQKWFFLKRQEWEYEAEVRLMTRVDRADETLPVENDEPIHLVRFEPAMVREVIFGYRTKQPLRKKIEKIARSFPSAQLYESKLDSKFFGLDIEPLR